MVKPAAIPDKVPVASYVHTLGLLGIFIGYFLIALSLSHPSTVTAPLTQSSRTNLVPGFLESIGFDWAILCYVWAGTSQRNVNLLALAGGRWNSPQQVFRDFLVAIPFWVVWEAVAISMSRGLVRGSHSAQDNWVVPHSPLEVTLWIATSLTAGFCEELVFRGYLQRQFTAVSQSVVVAVLAQGIVFGLVHPRGWRAVVTISVLGWLYGALAAWRKDLKPNMLAHALSDLWEGWLKHLLPLPF